MRILTQKLTEIKGVKKFPDLNKAKALIKSNELADTVTVVRKLRKEAGEEMGVLSKSKRDLLRLAIDKLTHELALVESISFSKATSKITSLLQL